MVFQGNSARVRTGHNMIKKYNKSTEKVKTVIAFEITNKVERSPN